MHGLLSFLLTYSFLFFGVYCRASTMFLMPDQQTIVHFYSETGVLYWLKDGKAIAQTQLPKGDSLSLQFVLEDNETIVASNSKRIYWFREGQKVAEYDGRRSARPVLLSDRKTIVFPEEGGVTWFREGKTVAKFSVQGSFYHPATVLHDGETIAIASDKLYWLKNGVEIARLEGDFRFNQAMEELQDGTLIAGTGRGNVFWIKERKIIHQLTLDTSLYTRPYILSDGATALFWTTEKLIWVKDGILLTTLNLRTSSPSFPVLGGDVFVGADSAVRKITNGVPGWIFFTQEMKDGVMPLTFLADGKTLLVSTPNYIYWVKDGRLVWKASHSYSVHASVLKDGRTVVVPSFHGVQWLRDGEVAAHFWF